MATHRPTHQSIHAGKPFASGSGQKLTLRGQLGVWSVMHVVRFSGAWSRPIAAAPLVHDTTVGVPMSPGTWNSWSGELNTDRMRT